jgi:hypothetical protein
MIFTCIYIVSLTLYLVLHPYYKLAYIKMQWGGPEEQVKERAARNPNAIDWYDEALQVVEAAMQEYSRRAKPTTPSASLGSSTGGISCDTASVESEYDRHRHELVEKASHQYHSDWRAELRCYLADMPDNVLKDTNIIEWWSVCIDYNLLCIILT